MESSKPAEILKIQGLIKRFNDCTALGGIDFSLSKGEIFALLGPNGAGKTTTLKIISGLLAQDGGEVFIKGEKFHRDHSKLKKFVTYVPDQPFVYPKLSGEEHLQFYADLYKMPRSKRKEKFDFFFDYFEYDIYRNELVETYSAGTRQKLLLTQALMVEPEIVLLDEPLTSIDPLVGRKFKTYLKDMAKGGVGVIFATHILSLAQEVSDRIGIIIDGHIITQGSLKKLLAASKGKDLEDFYFEVVMNYKN